MDPEEAVPGQYLDRSVIGYRPVRRLAFQYCRLDTHHLEGALKLIHSANHTRTHIPENTVLSVDQNSSMKVRSRSRGAGPQGRHVWPLLVGAVSVSGALKRTLGPSVDREGSQGRAEAARRGSLDGPVIDFFTSCDSKPVRGFVSVPMCQAGAQCGPAPVPAVPAGQPEYPGAVHLSAAAKAAWSGSAATRWAQSVARLR